MIDYGEKGKSPPFSTSFKVLIDFLPLHLFVRMFIHARCVYSGSEYPPRSLPRSSRTGVRHDVPFLLDAFFKMINPLIDPVTRQKLKFNPDCVKEGHFESNMLVREN